MADPRVFTVDNGTSSTCINQEQLASSQRRTFFQLAGKIGDLEVLNDIGASDIGKGLRTLASISNSVRTGCGAQPSILGSTVGKVLDSVEGGAEWVLNQVGLDGAVVKAVKVFNPGVANRAYGAATQIYQRVRQGNFHYTDIPTAMQDLQDLERLGRTIFSPFMDDAQSALHDVCQASPFAMDLVQRAPKYKFLFLAQFIYNTGYSDGPKSLAFVIKAADRPDIEYETQDVNFYNFQSKVITKTKFKEMQMTFHDDTKNQAMNFYNYYRQSTVPVANVAQGWNMKDNGMSIQPGINSSSFAALTGDVVSILSEIRLFHIYDSGQYMNVYKFIKPRITSMDLDGLDMSAGEVGNELTIKFFYDTVYIEDSVPVDPKKTPQYNIQDISHAGDGYSAMYPMHYVDDAAAITSPEPEFYNPAKVNQGCNPLNTTVTNKPTEPMTVDDGYGGIEF